MHKLIINEGKIVMSKGVFICCSIISFLITGCSTSNVIPVGNDVYMVSSSGAGFDTGGVRSNVYEAANKFCDKSAKSLKQVSYESVKGKLASHPPSADLMFKCVSKNNASKKMTPVNKDIYSELLKLNELKEKGIISEKEFESEKIKILNK